MSRTAGPPWRLLVAAACLAGISVAGVNGHALASAAAQFRSGTTVVSVDVSVRSGGTPVTGLTSADFTLTDRGVPQQIDAVSIGEIPIDVTLVIDVSGSTAGQLDQYRSDVVSISKILRPIDRVRLMAFSYEGTEVFPIQAARDRPPVERLATGSWSSIYDAMVAALLHQPDLARRQLIVGFTDGLDNRSITTTAQLQAVARQSESVLHVVGLASIPVISPSARGRGGPRTTTVGPRNDPLIQAAESTGGAAHGASRGGSIVNDFRRIFDEFRQSYVLRFRPTGVPLDGWHELTVKLPRKKGYDVHARKGYFGG